jgi:hypothetical protein
MAVEDTWSASLIVLREHGLFHYYKIHLVFHTSLCNVSDLRYILCLLFTVCFTTKYQLCRILSYNAYSLERARRFGTTSHIF